MLNKNKCKIIEILEKITDKPKIVGLVGDINTGKSMLIYSLISGLNEFYDCEIYAFGLRKKNFLGCPKEIKDTKKLEKIRNSIIFIDEFISLFDLEDRTKRREIENTLRLIYHHNNILILCGTPENFRKFVAGKLDMIIFKEVSFRDFINGSKTKRVFLNYSDAEKGSEVLTLKVDEALLYDGEDWFNFQFEKIDFFDTKAGNKPIAKLNPEKM